MYRISNQQKENADQAFRLTWDDTVPHTALRNNVSIVVDVGGVDYERKNIYYLTITADDGLLNSTGVVTIHVSDKNEPPHLYPHLVSLTALEADTLIPGDEPISSFIGNIGSYVRDPESHTVNIQITNCTIQGPTGGGTTAPTTSTYLSYSECARYFELGNGAGCVDVTTNGAGTCHLSRASDSNALPLDAELMSRIDISLNITDIHGLVGGGVVHVNVEDVNDILIERARLP